MTNIFLNKELRRLQKDCGVNKGDLLRFIDIVSYLAAKKEIPLADAEAYAGAIFKLMEERGI